MSVSSWTRNQWLLFDSIDSRDVPVYILTVLLALNKAKVF